MINLILTITYVQNSQILLQGASPGRIVLLDVAIIGNDHGHKNLHYHVIKGNICCNEEKCI
jgi:hypothetical protein